MYTKITESSLSPWPSGGRLGRNLRAAAGLRSSFKKKDSIRSNSRAEERLKEEKRSRDHEGGGQKEEPLLLLQTLSVHTQGQAKRERGKAITARRGTTTAASASAASGSVGLLLGS